MTHTDEFLISELQRFYYENDRVPIFTDITIKNGYLSGEVYKNHFKTWNNALIIAGFEINHIKNRLDGTETCSYCGKRADEMPGFRQWVYHNRERFCERHGSNGRGIPDYVKGELDINSAKGLGRAGEILVAKTLKIANEFDCNRISCGYHIDLYHDEYKKIDVKTSLLSYEYYSRWGFNFGAKKEANTYICIGLSSDRKIVDHVWVVPNEGNIRSQTSLDIKNTFSSLSNRRHWEVDVKPYNDMWKSMSLNKCKIMTDKKKEETEEEKQKFEEFKKAYFKKLGIVE